MTVSRHQLLVYKNERRVFFEGIEYETTAKEYDMLLLLAENPNRAFSREELLVKVWGDDYFGSDRAVDDLMKRIRKRWRIFLLRQYGDSAIV